MAHQNDPRHGGLQAIYWSDDGRAPWHTGPVRGGPQSNTIALGGALFSLHDNSSAFAAVSYDGGRSWPLFDGTSGAVARGHTPVPWSGAETRSPDGRRHVALVGSEILMLSEGLRIPAVSKLRYGLSLAGKLEVHIDIDDPVGFCRHSGCVSVFAQNDADLQNRRLHGTSLKLQPQLSWADARASWQASSTPYTT